MNLSMRTNRRNRVVDCEDMDLPNDDKLVREDVETYTNQQHLSGGKSVMVPRAEDRVVPPREDVEMRQLQYEFANMNPKSPLSPPNLDVSAQCSGPLLGTFNQQKTNRNPAKPQPTARQLDPRCDPRAIPQTQTSTRIYQPTDDQHHQPSLVQPMNLMPRENRHPRQPSAVEVVSPEPQTGRPSLEQIQLLAQNHNEPWKQVLIQKIMRQYQKSKKIVQVAPDADLEEQFGKKKEENVRMKVVPPEPIEEDVVIISDTDFDFKDIGQKRDEKPTMVVQPELNLLHFQPTATENENTAAFAFPHLTDYYDDTEKFRRSTFRKGHILPGTQTSLNHLLSSYCTDPKDLSVGCHGILTTQNNKPTNFGEYEETENEFGYTFIKEAGKGSFGCVKMYSDNSTKQEFVMKQILRVDNSFQLEAKLHSELHHVNVTQMFGFIIRDGKPEILMEYAGVSMIEYTMKAESEEDLHEDKIQDILYQGLSGLEYLDQKKIIHYDIKPENMCILKINGRLKVKITDLGSAKEEKEPPDFKGCTVEYLSPELGINLISSKYAGRLDLGFNTSDYELTTKSDIFSLALSIMFMYRRGHVVIALFNNGKMTYHGLQENMVTTIRQQILVYLAKNPSSVRTLLIPDVCSSAMKSILTDMVEEIPTKRPTATEIKNNMDDLIFRDKRATQMPVFLTYSSSNLDKHVNLTRQLSSRGTINADQGGVGKSIPGYSRRISRDRGTHPYGYISREQKMDTSDVDVHAELKELVPRFSNMQ